MTLALYLAGFQQILHQLENGNDMPAFLGMRLIRWKKLRQHQNDRGEQSLRRIISSVIQKAFLILSLCSIDKFLLISVLSPAKALVSREFSGL